MNIYDFAMKMEQDGESYYRELIKNSLTPGIKKIFTMLADDEVTHYYYVEEMKNSASVQFDDSTILSDAKNVFEELKEKYETIDDDISQIQAYKKAQDIEKKSEDFYREKVKEITNKEEYRKIFLKIADEEKRHYFLLENIIELVSRPQTWLENAEFNHLDDY